MTSRKFFDHAAMYVGQTESEIKLHLAATPRKKCLSIINKHHSINFRLFIFYIMENLAKDNVSRAI